MSWTVSNLQRPFREDFSLEKSGIIAEKNHKYLGVVLSALTSRKKRRPFSISKRALAVASETAGREDHSGLIFLQQEDRSHGHPKHKLSASLP